MATKEEIKKYPNQVNGKKKSSDMKPVIIIVAVIVVAVLLLVVVLLPMLANMWFENTWDNVDTEIGREMLDTLTTLSRTSAIDDAFCDGTMLTVLVRATGTQALPASTVSVYFENVFVGSNAAEISPGNIEEIETDVGVDCSSGEVKVTSPGTPQGTLFTI